MLCFHPTLTFWKTPTLLPSPDVIISCEAFCSPAHPQAWCCVLHDAADYLDGVSFLCCSVSQSVGLIMRREKAWVVSLSPRLSLTFHIPGAQGRYMEGRPSEVWLPFFKKPLCCVGNVWGGRVGYPGGVPMGGVPMGDASG